MYSRGWCRLSILMPIKVTGETARPPDNPGKTMKKMLSLVSLLLTACDVPDTEERLAAMHLPPPGFVGDPVQGEPLFSRFCQSCHGAGGAGSEQGPPLVNEVYRPGHHANLAFHMAVRDGVRAHHWGFGDMPPVEGVSPRETEHIAAYIRRQQEQAGVQ